MNGYRAAAPCLVFAALVSACRPFDRVDRIRENGVEVVLNRVEPYRLKGRPSTFDLEPVLTIDTEREDLVSRGMGSAGEFGVDGEGNIYIVAFKNKLDFIYRFDTKGRLLNSFGRYGQGPGEIEWPFLNQVFEDGRIALTDRLRKFIVFDKSGAAVKEIKPGFTFMRVHVLDNDLCLVERSRTEAAISAETPMVRTLDLCDARFETIKELHRRSAPAMEGNKRLQSFFMWRVSAGHVYVADESLGYEILDFELNGDLRRKIRKEYRPVKATSEIKKAIVGPAYGQPGLERYFPDPLPPLSSFFTDDEGRLFVLTYESGDRPGEIVCDLFDPDGVFIGRKSLNLLWAGLYGGPKYGLARKGLLYTVRVKESGYHEYRVERMIWR